MQQKSKTNFTPTLRMFISRVITPVVLIAGLLILVIFNFNGVLKAAQTDDNHFHGLYSFSNGSFGDSFNQNAGLDRPILKYNGHELLTYAQWSSTFSVDGNVVDLWNTTQGYNVDEANKTVYNTVTSTDGWQLIQVTKLVNDHTVTVTYNFTARPITTVPPTHYELDIIHAHDFWYKPQITDTSFSANVMPTDSTKILSDDKKNLATSLGKITLQTSSSDLPTQAQIKVNKLYSALMSDGNTVPWVTSFETVYTIDNPAPSRVITLGTETITFTPAQTSSTAAIGGPVPIRVH